MTPNPPLPQSIQDLLNAARQAASRAYAPYSHFTVGAALLGSNGIVYPGFNIENASYGLTLCAERSAVVLAMSDGCRSWQHLAVVSPASVSPCGSCRQFLAEFDLQLPIWIGGLDPSHPIRSWTLQQLLPDTMTLDQARHDFGKPPAPHQPY